MVWHKAPNDGVPCLVISSELFLVLAHHHGLALGAHHDLVLGALEIVHPHQGLVGTGGEQRRLVDQVGQIGTGEPWGTAGDNGRIHIISRRHLAHVHLEDLLAAAHVGQRHHHLAVETAGAQQRRVEHVGTVGGGDDDDALVAFETVHLHQQLVEGLLALVVTAAEAGAAVAADGVDLVDEDDAGRVLLGLLEHVAHAGGAHADEHLHEIGAGDGEERHLGLTGNGLGQQGLTGTRRAHHQYAAGDLAAQFLELARVAQELDQLSDIFLGLFHAGDIVKSDFDLIFAQQAGTALAKGHCSAAGATALHLPHEEDPDTDEQQEREPGDEDLRQQAGFFRRRGFDTDPAIEEIGNESWIIRCIGGELISLLHQAMDRLAFDNHTLDSALLYVLQELGVFQRLAGSALGTEIGEDRHQDEGNHHPEQNIFHYVVQN